jgi:hypothetical protein
MDNQPIIETKNYRKPKMPKKKKIAIAVYASAAAICVLAVAFWFVHPHMYFIEHQVLKAPTCTETGAALFKCFCGETDEKTVNATGHNEAIVKGYSATKTESGLTDGIRCSVCGEILKEQNLIYAGSQGLKYTVTSDTTCEITGIGTCKDTDVVISNYYDGYKVTSIGEKAFYIRNYLTSITIPDSVTSIGDYAFDNCSSLTSIIIPDSVTSIGKGAFGICESLTSITIPDGVTDISNNIFGSCGNLASVTMSDKVTSIGNSSFYNCGKLESITIPKSVTSIGNYTFQECKRLTSINYTGTIEEWQNLPKGSNWNYDTGSYTVYCTDGTVSKAGTVTYY